LGEVPLVLPTRGGDRRAEFDRMLDALGVTPTVAFESDERSSWTPAVLAGVGCCLWYRAQGDLAAEHGARVVALDRPLGRTIGVVHRPGRQSAAVRALLEVARDHAAREGLAVASPGHRRARATPARSGQLPV